MIILKGSGSWQETKYLLSWNSTSRHRERNPLGIELFSIIALHHRALGDVLSQTEIWLRIKVTTLSPHPPHNKPWFRIWLKLWSGWGEVRPSACSFVLCWALLLQGLHEFPHYVVSFHMLLKWLLWNDFKNPLLHRNWVPPWAPHSNISMNICGYVFVCGNGLKTHCIILNTICDHYVLGMRETWNSLTI